MLNCQNQPAALRSSRIRIRDGQKAGVHQQRGVVLMIALIILVVMTMGGIALIRTVDTTNLIAGNLAFQQAATRSGDRATEDAVQNFLEVNVPDKFHNDDALNGYIASTPTSGNPSNWDTYWKTYLNPNPVSVPVATKSCVDHVCTLPTDFAGNTVSYTIQRLCLTAGDPLMFTTGCSNAPDKNATRGGSLASGALPLPEPVKYYYRITARVAGPRNTTSYVQTIVAK
jgi:type IV pilus assembly protein PilX